MIDPAAETELARLLQECGFKLVSPDAVANADVAVTGEAFSAYGLQKGNLIACKARIELKAVKSNGDILVVDRETSVAVDVAEQTAAKIALQNAATAIAERIVPQLAK